MKTGSTTNSKSRRLIVGSTLVSLVLILAIFSLALHNSGTVGHSSTSTTSTDATTSAVISTDFSSNSSVDQTSTGGTVTQILVNPCNCTLNLRDAWPIYNTMQDLASGSGIVVVANVTAVKTVGVSIAAVNWYNPNSTNIIPVTLYNMTVTTVISGPPTVQPGQVFPLTQIGGTIKSASMNLTGYPSLVIGSSYVFFLSYPYVINGGPVITVLLGGAAPWTFVTTGGPQGLFTVQNGEVYSLDNMYPQADAWLPVKANGIPLGQFISEIRSAIGVSATSISASTTISTQSNSTSLAG